MTQYLLQHRHEPHECGVVFASFKGYASLLRHRATFASCRAGGHAIWWTVRRRRGAVMSVRRPMGVGASEIRVRDQGVPPMWANTQR